MSDVDNAALIAHGLERAYRMAIGLEAAARERLGDAEYPFPDLAQWLFASELVAILDEMRTSQLIGRLESNTSTFREVAE